MASLNILIYQSKRIIDCLDTLIYLGRFMLSTIILYMHCQICLQFCQYNDNICVSFRRNFKMFLRRVNTFANRCRRIFFKGRAFSITGWSNYFTSFTLLQSSVILTLMKFSCPVRRNKG